jgi:hypothetical protein
MPTLLTPPTLERLLQGLHESEIRCGIQNDPPAGGITAWIDYGSRTEKATFYRTIVGDRQVWPAADRIAAWMHETALRLFPDSPYLLRQLSEKASTSENAFVRYLAATRSTAALSTYRPTFWPIQPLNLGVKVAKHYDRR